MTRHEFEVYKETFEKEGYIHENVVKELFEIADWHFGAMASKKELNMEPGC